jgi:hypothetical protein
MAQVGQPGDAIPLDIAAQLCEEVQETNRTHWHAFKSLWCWGCRTFARGRHEQMCYRATPTNRGCQQVNALYAERFEAWQRT